MLRAIAFLVAFFLTAAPALADERISNFDVVIDVQKDGDIMVSETIAVTVEGRQIRRGIFRDLPRFYEKHGNKLPYRYVVKRVTRNGEREKYEIEKTGNAYRIRIGDADVLLSNGPHVYDITYEVKNQARYFDGYDEVYWNATGTYWAFPIDSASATVRLPDGAGAIQTAAYTGRRGGNERNYDYAFRNGAHIFRTTKPLAAREGLTVSVGFEKGIVDPPSAGDARAEWWARNASLVVLALAALGIGGYYVNAWRLVGRDPAKGPVFPVYEPPENLSPAAIHHVYYRGTRGHNAFIATLVDLAVRKRIKIDVEDKKETHLSKLAADEADTSTPEGRLERDLFGGRESFSFGKKYSAALTMGLASFESALAKKYGKPYFKWNRGFLVFAIVLSGVAFLLALNFAIEWTSLHTIGVGALVLMAGAASYFLPAPTPAGQKTRTAIEGFRLYLKTAEKLQLNAAEVGSEAPPPMSVERYERFLPYAIALDVEKPWTEHFEKLMPKEAAEYRPHWSHGRFGGSRSLAGLNSALVSSMSSGVSSSLPQSSGSSGSGGGGSSGGGGGGGGGGGW